MKLQPLLVGIMAGALTLGVLASVATPVDSSRESKVIRKSELSDVEKAAHLLNRLAYGPRPGDLEGVIERGFSAYIEEQLQPEKLDASGLDARLKPLESIHLSSTELFSLFPPGFLVRRLVEDGKIDESYGPRAFAGAAADRDEGSMPAMNRGAARRRGFQNFVYRPITRLPEPVESPGRFGGGPSASVEGVNPQQQVVLQLQAAKLLRAVYSPRQLEEVMVDFWFNHFNVFIQKGQSRLAVTGYERDVIRPHALGRFRELLGATAKSPAMLTYLDNFQSASPDSMIGRRRNRGLNENYARELMELHTLGVDAGYTQQDVVEVARVFTGWTLGDARGGGERGAFQFLRAMHHPGPKVILGQEIDAAGVEEGEKVLDLLAAHPATARFLSEKLARRFVQDDPPESLVSEVAKTYEKTQGDIRAMLRTIFYSKEFWSRQAYQSKAKKPLELFASLARAVDAELHPTPQMLEIMTQLGEPLYLCQPPTGYPDTADAWLNTGTLLTRWNVAVGVASASSPGIKPAARDDLRDRPAGEVIDELSEQLLAGRMSPASRERLEETVRVELGPAWKGADQPLPDKAIQLVAGVIMGSPDFQRR